MSKTRLRQPQIEGTIYPWEDPWISKILQMNFVFVGDGRKALFLRNDGDEKFPYLKTEKGFHRREPAQP